MLAQPQHLPFLVSEAVFDAAFGRIAVKRIQHWGGYIQARPGEISHNDGGRGVCWDDSDDHVLEIITDHAELDRSFGGLSRRWI